MPSRIVSSSSTTATRFPGLSHGSTLARVRDAARPPLFGHNPPRNLRAGSPRPSRAGLLRRNRRTDASLGYRAARCHGRRLTIVLHGSTDVGVHHGLGAGFAPRRGAVAEDQRARGAGRRPSAARCCRCRTRELDRRVDQQRGMHQRLLPAARSADRRHGSTTETRSRGIFGVSVYRCHLKVTRHGSPAGPRLAPARCRSASTGTRPACRSASPIHAGLVRRAAVDVARPGGSVRRRGDGQSGCSGPGINAPVPALDGSRR